MRKLFVIVLKEQMIHENLCITIHAQIICNEIRIASTIEIYPPHIIDARIICQRDLELQSVSRPIPPVVQILQLLFTIVFEFDCVRYIPYSQMRHVLFVIVFASRNQDRYRRLY